jgi:hypothetical protein
MLHVATVHYQSPRWIEIQSEHLRRHLPLPFKTWTSLEGIDPSYRTFFDEVLEQRGPHAGKLNHLALEICHAAAADDDLIMFLDGDAFPIADPMPAVSDALERAPLVAVRRAENLDDPQPHPCFCVTTVGTWRSLPGDWSVAPVWPGVKGKPVSDVGANLLRALQLTQTPWEQLLRSNGTRLHPLFFAVYGEIVYHHGAGFREGALPRAERQRLKARAADQQRSHPAARLLRSGLERLRGSGWQEAIERGEELSRQVYEAIRSGQPDWLEQISDPLAASPS